jgi:putative transcriptional regulator
VTSAPGPSLAGQLLIAAPVLLDPNFHRTIVLVVDHDEDGALGVVLNRPGEVDAGAAVPELDEVVTSGDLVFEGGPVRPEAVIALAEYSDDASPESARIVGSVGVLASGEDLLQIARRVVRARVFLGYAGWGPGQLEDELSDEAWYTEAARAGDVFDGDPATLWRRVLERKGGSYRLVARMPEDPSLN